VLLTRAFSDIQTVDSGVLSVNTEINSRMDNLFQYATFPKSTSKKLLKEERPMDCVLEVVLRTQALSVWNLQVLFQRTVLCSYANARRVFLRGFHLIYKAR
jgi:hypothetical protein